jgi:hypothetical protein
MVLDRLGHDPERRGGARNNFYIPIKNLVRTKLIGRLL